MPWGPATIDYHDDLAGMTFVSGHTLPSRIFAYAHDALSTFNHPLVQLGPADPQFPRLTAATFARGTLSFTFYAPLALHIGVALWADPATLRLSGANVVPAGRAGAVVTFDLPAGASTQSLRCGGCTSTTLIYST